MPPKKRQNDIGDLIFKLRNETLDYLETATNSSNEAARRKAQTDVIKKVLNDLLKAEQDIKRKRNEGQRARDTAHHRFTVSVDGLQNRDFGEDKRAKVNSIIVTKDVDMENLKRGIEKAKQEQVAADLRRRIANLNEEAQKAVLERDIANLTNLPKVIQERADAIDKLHIKIGEALLQDDALTAAIHLTEFKVLLDSGDDLPGEGERNRQYPLQDYADLERFIDPEYEDKLADRIMKDVSPTGDAETPDDKSKFGDGSLKDYLEAIKETFDAAGELEKAKVRLKELDEHLKVLQSKRLPENIRKRYEEEPVVTPQSATAQGASSASAKPAAEPDEKNE
jgi:hypothetical protein